MLEAAVPSPNTLPAEEAMVLLKEGLVPNAAPPPNAGELPKEGGLPNTGALPKPPVEGEINKCLKKGLKVVEHIQGVAWSSALFLQKNKR